MAGWLVQNQHLRLHSHNGGQIQQLLLAAGEGGHIPMEPVLNAEIAGHFRNPGTHGLLVAAQAFQAEGQLVPDLVRDDLIVRVLHDKADFCRLIPVGNLTQGHAVKENLPTAFSAGGQHGFQLTQQGAFPTAGGTAQDKKFSPFNGKTDVLQAVPPLGGGIGEGQIPDLEMCHAMASFVCSAAGSRANAP